MMTADELIDKYLAEKMTPGARKAYSKLENGGKVCADCRIIVPKYPGRYPQECPACGNELEDLQNSPRYSEAYDDHDGYSDSLAYPIDNSDRLLQQAKDRRARQAQMRRVSQDRIPLGGPQDYDLGYGS